MKVIATIASANFRSCSIETSLVIQQSNNIGVKYLQDLLIFRARLCSYYHNTLVVKHLARICICVK
ncbi:Uncharacterised protein [Vibrio cholerae]|nr:Uncharacterised protein [Vibrio cholerae]